MHTDRLLARNDLEVILENFPDVVMLLTPDRSIISANKAITALTGKSSGSYIGRSMEELFPSKKISAQVNRTVAQTFHSGLPQMTEVDMGSGKLKGNAYRIHLIPLSADNQNSEVTGILAVMRDITRERELMADRDKVIEEQRILSQRLINKANKLQSFAYIISHDLRSPIANLVGLMELYEQRQKADERKEIVDMILKSIDRLNEIVQDLTEIIKIQQGLEMKLEEVEFDQVLKLVSESIELRMHQSEVTIHPDFRACRRFVYSKAYIESILMNLLTNAIKYRHPERAPVIQITTWKRGSDVVLVFEDNGTGIDLERFGHKIFGLRKTFHGNQDARGVGLFITRSQVEALGGTIEVASEVGVGTKFTIRFFQEDPV